MARPGEKGSLPLPGIASRRPRTYFPSNPVAQTSWLTHLRSRTRLTNLAVSLILAITTLSLLLNASYILSPRRTDADTSRRRLVDKGWADHVSPSLLASGIPLSIETTIERDARTEGLDHMIMVPGHAIWTGGDVSRVEEDEQWVLEPMQRGGSVRTYLRHIEMGVELMKEDERSLLVFSGGATRSPPSPPLSEAQSYLSLAQALKLIPSSPLPAANERLPPNMRVTTEEYALDSYENLLFAVARFHEVTGRWPGRITVVGYGMKRRRFELLHARAIGWPEEAFDYRGIDDDGDTTEHYAGELKYGFTPFLSSPSGCHPPLSIKRQFRNPFSRYHPYHISNPDLIDLLEWCPSPKEDVGENGEGLEVFPGPLPWRDGVHGASGVDGSTVWDRERD